MKTLLLSLFTIFCFKSFAQVKNNTKIDKANVVNIYNGNVSIGQVIINENSPSMAILSNITRTKNTSGEIETKFFFKSKNHQPFYDLIIKMEFDKPIISGDLSADGIYTAGDEYSLDKMAYQINAQSIGATSFVITIISEKPVFTKIYGAFADN